MLDKIEIDNLIFSYSRAGRNSLDGISLQLKPRGCVAVLGHNGSGKTTFLKLISGVVTGQEGVLSGDVRFGNKSLFDLDFSERIKQVCYVGSDLNIYFAITVRDVLEFGFYSRQKIDFEKILEVSNLMRLSSLLDRDVRTLSGGERQRVLLARSLIVDSQVIILDETLSKMDLENQLEYGQLLKKIANEKLILFVGHDLNFSLRWADDLILFKHGKILKTGSVEEVGTPEFLDSLFSDRGFEWIKDLISNRYQVSYRFTYK